MSPMKRRRFLQTVAGGSLVVAFGCGNEVVPAPLASLPVGSDGVLRVELGRYPDLVPVGGAISLDVALAEDSPYVAARGGILLVHRADTVFVASQSRCPHRGCPLGYSASDGLIACPCHGSRFLAAADPVAPLSCAGDVVHLPARQSLTMYDVSFQAGTITIDLKRTLCAPVLPASVDGMLTLSFADFPSLSSPGGVVVGQPADVDDTLIVVRLDAATVLASTAICTHLGCKVGWAQANTRFECPCHGSVYHLDGSVENGPATQPLRSYSAALTSDAVLVTIVL